MNPKELIRGNYLALIEHAGWEYVKRIRSSGVVVLVATTAEGRIILVEQYRKAVDANVLELPAGLVGDEKGFENESLESAARRELEEETGYYAESIEHLTQGPVTPGMSSETVTVFRATNLRRTGSGGGTPDENITVHEIPLDSAESWLQEKLTAANGKLLLDPKVYMGLYFAR